ncbi:hypothetical protein B0O99DRAFT_614483 [Bisporella sp. PMI_857]|nr:hypothetical protein B0O99DRAFT_614483 [Bisporella sp. PMI_857]
MYTAILVGPEDTESPISVPSNISTPSLVVSPMIISLPMQPLTPLWTIKSEPPISALDINKEGSGISPETETSPSQLSNMNAMPTGNRKRARTRTLENNVEVMRIK